MRSAFTVRLTVRLALAISLLIPLLMPLASQAEKSRKLSAQSFARSDQRRLANYDVRQRQRALHRERPTASQLAIVKQLQDQVQGVQIRFSPVTGTLKHLFSLSERLTAPRRDAPVAIARDFLRTHRALFRLQDREIDDLVIAKNYRTKHNGVTHIVFKPFHQGLAVFQSDIRVNIDRDGRILSVSGNYFPGLTVASTPTLSAAEAVRVAARHLAPDLSFSSVLKSPAKGMEQMTLFDRGPFTQDITAKLTIFPTPDGGRLAWRTRLHLFDRLAWYDILVDAHTSEILFRYNLYKFSEPQGLVFDVHPDLGPQVLRSFVGDPIASPNTWVDPLPNISTRGNNAMTLPAAKNAEQHFGFPFSNFYNTEGINPFDLNRQTLRFTPNANGGYDAELVPLIYDSQLGTNITDQLASFGFPDPDDGSARYRLEFSFPFFGQSQRGLFINANGSVTFLAGDDDFSESWSDMMLGRPRIAALWDDLDPGSGTGVFAKNVEGGVVITWRNVPQFGESDSNTVQLALFETGIIEISFRTVNVEDGLVGLTPGGGDFDLNVVDFSNGGPITSPREGLAQKFPSPELEAATTNLFYHLNFIHDYLYRLGFDEAAGNFQSDNFGRGGIGQDPVIALPQDGGFNNAFFAPAEEGDSPLSGFLLFTSPPFRQADSSYDADIIYHEYVHGLTTRLIGTPFDIAVLLDIQSDAMGEGWSDIYSASITNDPITGEYTTGNSETGIREVNFAANALSYGDLGNRFGPISALFADDPGGLNLDTAFTPQIHTDGEIWASTLWGLRVALGQETFEQLITDALKLTPTNPSMLDARDAILMADVVSHGGANQATIWSAFAAKGMGFSAGSEDANDTIVFQAFDTPSSPLPTESITIFFDDMDSGENGWGVEGDDGDAGPAPWHQSTRRAASGENAWYYGQESSGSYGTGGRNFGALTSPVIELPAIPSGGALVLEFDHFKRTNLPGFFSFFDLDLDNGHVRIIDVATGEIRQIAFVGDVFGDDESFQHEMINLSAFAGRSIRIQFYFDEYLDLSFIEKGEGWYIDNVRVSQRVP